MTPTFDPIAPWYLIALAAAGIAGLTLWAYDKRLRGTTGRWRWVALTLRMIAILLCVLAALKPSLLMMRKVKQTASILFLIDGSSSMELNDEANGRSRWDAARATLDQALKSVRRPGARLEVKALRFDPKLRDYKPGDTTPPKGRETAIGTALDEAIKQSAGTRILAIALLSDGRSNAGLPPLAAAERLRGLQVPLVTVGFGTEDIGRGSRDLSARELVAGPVVFVKNEIDVRGTIGVRGYPPGETIDVELYVEDEKVPVKRIQVRTKPGETTVPVTMKWTPQKPGETKLTLKVRPKDGEQIKTNNEISGYVTVQKGGLAVLYLQGPNFSWESRFLTRSLDAAQEIQVDLKVLKRSVREDPALLSEQELAGGYDVIILGDLPADFLTPAQQELLVRLVRRGMGLMMLGGRSSFGAGGWAGTSLSDILPTEIHPGDAQIEPPDGLPVRPNATGLENFVLRLAPNRADNARVWASLPPIPGANRLGPAKQSAVVWASQPDGEPLMVGQEVPKGRVLAFGGETWPWARANEESQAAHRRFWRQAILWLSHKEDQGENEIRVTLDRRRVALGQNLGITATARDAKNEPMADVKFEAKVEPIGGTEARVEPVDLFNQATDARGTHFPTGQPGEYRVTVTAMRNNQAIGSDRARFLVYQDDRELDNPAADHLLLKQLAQITGGKALSPEDLVPRYLKTLNTDVLTESVVQKEVRLWDNWPFLLVFAAVLTLEWWLRKRNGWV